MELFGLTDNGTEAKIGSSSEFYKNRIRLLCHAEHMQQAIVNKEMTEGHARTLLALGDRPQERETLFREILLKKLPVRAVERIVRSIAQERVHKYHRKSPEMAELDLNPVLALPDRTVALDPRVRLARQAPRHRAKSW